MALDPNILLQGARVPQVDLQAAMRSPFQGAALVNEIQQMPLENQLLQQKAALNEQALQQGQQQIDQDEMQRFALGAQTAINAFERGDSNGVVRTILDTFQGNPQAQAQELAEFNNDPESYIAQAKDFVGSAKSQGFIKGSGATADQKTREQLIKDIEPALDDRGRFNPKKADAKALSAAIELGIASRAGATTAQERIATDPELTKKVATAEATIKKAIAGEVAAAKSRGETASDLAKAEAALPAVEQVVGKLKLLSEDATFTLAGKAFNRVAKELGVSTKGDTSRSSMVAIVDNQVLPLLKPIFGAAFTAAEGDRLRDALLNPDSTPESRKAQLDAFLEQMRRNIEVKRRELDPTIVQPGMDLKTLSDEELFNF